MVDLGKLKAEQQRLSRRIMTVDDFPEEVKMIGGGSSVYTEDKIIYAIVVIDAKTMEIKEKKYTIMDCKFPHLPEFLSYRESPACVDTYHKLEIDPDIILIKGNGILHPRKFGVASHVGLLIDKATIGVSKHLLFGKQRDDTIYDQKEVIGKVLETKEHAKPVYVSPGQRISLKTSMEIVKTTLEKHKLPEPIHQAHKYANKIKKGLKENNKEQ